MTAPAADQVDGLPGVVHPDADDAQRAGVEAAAPPQAGHVTQLILAVADQQRLRAIDSDVTRPGRQPGAVVAVEQVRQQLQGGAALVIAVRGAPDHLGVGTEGGIVHERAPADGAQVHPEFLPVGEGIKAGGRILAVQSQVQGEVVAGPGADHQEGQAVLGGDPGHQRLGSVATGHPEQIGAIGYRLAGQGGDVHNPRAVQQHHLGAQRLRLVLQPEFDHLPPARPRVHDQERPARTCRRDGRHGRVLTAAAQRGPADGGREHHQRHRHDGDPQQVGHRIGHQDEHGRRDDQDQRDPPEHTPMGQEPVRARQHDTHADDGERHQRQAAPPRDGDHQRHGRQHQGERGAGEPAPGPHLHHVSPCPRLDCKARRRGRTTRCGAGGDPGLHAEVAA